MEGAVRAGVGGGAGGGGGAAPSPQDACVGVMAGRLLERLGVPAVSAGAFDVSVALANAFTLDAARRSTLLARGAGRASCNLSDVAKALEEMGYSLSDLYEYSRSEVCRSLQEAARPLPELAEPLAATQLPPIEPSIAEVNMDRNHKRRGAQSASPSYVPDYLPAFPPAYTYVHTHTATDMDPAPRKPAEIAASKLAAEQSLVNMARATGQTSGSGSARYDAAMDASALPIAISSEPVWDLPPAPPLYRVPVDTPGNPFMRRVALSRYYPDDPELPEQDAQAMADRERAAELLSISYAHDLLLFESPKAAASKIELVRGQLSAPAASASVSAAPAVSGGGMVVVAPTVDDDVVEEEF